MRILALTIAMTTLLPSVARADDSPFARKNLVAWCIVPFDAKKRGPEERAAMLQRLGITRLAYDWRANHIPTFDDEIKALKKRNIRLQSFWCTSSLNPEKQGHIKTILDVLKRNGVKTELWVMLADGRLNSLKGQERVDAAAKALGWLAKEAGKIGCKVGLYNHGGWFGEPENQIAIINKMGVKNVGIVYNFHHGHHHIERFAKLFAQMKPYLLAVNLNGMKKPGPKILTLGKGDEELAMMTVISKSGYDGPIGILDHVSSADSEVILRQNIDGLKGLLQKLGDRDALKTYKK